MASVICSFNWFSTPFALSISEFIASVFFFSAALALALSSFIAATNDVLFVVVKVVRSPSTVVALVTSASIAFLLACSAAVALFLSAIMSSLRPLKSEIDFFILPTISPVVSPLVISPAIVASSKVTMVSFNSPPSISTFSDSACFALAISSSKAVCKFSISWLLLSAKSSILLPKSVSAFSALDCSAVIASEASFLADSIAEATVLVSSKPSPNCFCKFSSAFVALVVSSEIAFAFACSAAVALFCSASMSEALVVISPSNLSISLWTVFSALNPSPIWSWISFSACVALVCSAVMAFSNSVSLSPLAFASASIAACKVDCRVESAFSLSVISWFNLSDKSWELASTSSNLLATVF